MKRRFFVLALVTLTGVLALSACEFSVSTANIQEVQLARDEAGANPTSEFQPEETVYAIVTLANAPDDTELKAAWSVVDVGAAAEPGQLIDEVELQAGDGTHFFNLAPTAPFPPGRYKVDIYLNGELAETREFSVAGEVAQAVEEAPAEQPAQEPGAGDTPEAPVEPDPGTATGAVTTLDGVRAATVRIMSQGSFLDPEFGTMTNAAGQGSGFIIDPSGIAVTNNHVVTGAAFLEVFLEGEEAPRNARVLGVSECSDLAVIDIDGEGFPYLQWMEGDIAVGQEIYVAGYPLFGNEEYTLTRGIVSKAEADGETNWASVDRVLEVDATINGGNSGGPLVTEGGQAVGVNYAARTDTGQGFTISRDEALPVIELLRSGEDVNSIGINGQAVMSEDGSIFGIWVSSVASGSPADEAGIQSGDILTRLEGLVLATDGTMADYCDILRSHDADDVLRVEVLRLGTGEYLEGQLNGNPLQTTTVIDLGEDVAAGETYDSYTSISDDSGRLSVEVPSSWSDIQGGGWVTDDEETLGPGLIAAPSVDDYLNTWTAPGMFFGASEQDELRGDTNALLDTYDLSGACTYDGRSDYDDGLYAGAYDVWSACGGEATQFVVLAAEPEDSSYVVLVQVQVTSTADEEALGHILDTFIVAE